MKLFLDALGPWFIPCISANPVGPPRSSPGGWGDSHSLLVTMGSIGLQGGPQTCPYQSSSVLRTSGPPSSRNLTDRSEEITAKIG